MKTFWGDVLDGNPFVYVALVAVFATVAALGWSVREMKRAAPPNVVPVYELSARLWVAQWGPRTAGSQVRCGGGAYGSYTCTVMPPAGVPYVLNCTDESPAATRCWVKVSNP